MPRRVNIFIFSYVFHIIMCSKVISWTFYHIPGISNKYISKYNKVSKYSLKRINVLLNSSPRYSTSIFTLSSDNSLDENVINLTKQIKEKANEIRQMKEQKVDKAILTNDIQVLLQLKATFKDLTGQSFDPPVPEKSNMKTDTTQKVDKSPSQESLSIKEIPNIPLPTTDYFSVSPSSTDIQCGKYQTIIASMDPLHVGHKNYFDVTKHQELVEGDIVWIRGRVSNVRAKGNACFIVIRSNAMDTIQTCHFKDKESPESSKELIKFVSSHITLESIVDIQGVVSNADVKSCSIGSKELQIRKIFIVSEAPVQLPFLLEDASRSELEIQESQSTERPYPSVSQDMRLNNRWLDLRVPANNAIMRIKSGIMQLFRESLYQQGFMEINSPKLIPGESEGGSEVFRLNYFGQGACLAQSPQLYKQMAISSDLDRVFEVGPVFRAENSNTRRHLCEFTGLDIEMAIKDHYNEVLIVIHRMFRHIFNGLEERYARELQVIREQYPSEPVQFTEEPLIIHWMDAMSLLQENGVEVDIDEDLSSAIELKLGELVKSKYNADFFILDQYPLKIRPFYTMPSSDKQGKSSNSYDMFIRGQEICSGAQRCHDPDLLEARIKEKGIPLEPLKYYIDSFRHGVSPHAGAGIGLERVVFLYLGLDNIRKASMFPRDPNRCVP